MGAGALPADSSLEVVVTVSVLRVVDAIDAIREDLRRAPQLHELEAATGMDAATVVHAVFLASERGWVCGSLASRTLDMTDEGRAALDELPAEGITRGDVVEVVVHLARLERAATTWRRIAELRRARCAAYRVALEDARRVTSDEAVRALLTSMLEDGDLTPETIASALGEVTP